MKRKITYDLLMLLAVILLLVLLKVPYLNLLLAASLILIYSNKKSSIQNELGFKIPAIFLKTVLTSIGLAISIVFLSYFVFLPIIENLTNVPLELGVFEQLQGNLSLLLPSLAIGWIVGGFLEEVIFRAFMITRFSNLFPNHAGIAASVILPSILFGFLHTYQGPSGQFLTGVVGLMLAVIYIVNKRNIWLNILTHGFVNTVSMTLLYFDLL
ncbi:MAG: CPBP family intramembrane glutamic endopeptidase [Cyclobacteriaceae bacterium]